MSSTSAKSLARRRRHDRVRNKVRGTTTRPRLVVFRSNTGIYAQLVDDAAGHTLAAASNLDSSLPSTEDGENGKSGKIGVAHAVGKLIAERAGAAGICKVVFDRGGNRYQGRVKALADGAREGGLEF